MRVKRNRLRNRISIIEQGSSIGSMGEVIDSPVEFKKVWASVYPAKADESITHKQEQMDITHKIRVRYIPNLKNNMRIKMGEREFHIVSILNFNEQNKFLDILAIEET